MGARLLTLTVPRFGVLVEGPSDSVLLPHLFREATETKDLLYRFVPGLSEIDAADMRSLTRQAGNAVCLLDGDDGGSSLRKQLEPIFSADRILDFGQLQAGMTLEDLLTPEAFADAVNAELSTWAWSHLNVDATQLPTVGRWATVAAALKADGKRESDLSKVRVAQRAVDSARSMDADEQRPLLDPQYRDGIVAIHATLTATFGQDG